MKLLLWLFTDAIDTVWLYLASRASCFCVSRSLSTRVCSDVEIETDVALQAQY